MKVDDLQTQYHGKTRSACSLVAGGWCREHGAGLDEAPRPRQQIAIETVNRQVDYDAAQHEVISMKKVRWIGEQSPV
jgi:hypothetical protein